MRAMNDRCHDERRQALARIVQEKLGDLAQKGGEVLMTGIDSLRPGPFYMLGLNPGLGSNTSTLDQVTRWNLVDFSAYNHQCWNAVCWDKDSFGRQDTLTTCTHDRGGRPHQQTVRRIVANILPEKTALESIVATNAIFAASLRAQTFLKDTGYTLEQAWELCWPVHQFMLGIVRPKVIFCWGYGETHSAFAFLRAKSRTHRVTRGPGYKAFDAEFELESGALMPLVIGVFHPSYGYRIARSEQVLRQHIEERVGRPPTR
jgi:hypothetical protein